MTAAELRLNRLKLRLKSAPIADLEASVIREMAVVRPLIRPNMKVALAVGSRGIANIAAIVRTVVRCMKDFGAEPFIVPAMGSHGGATAEGQAEILAGYGITEDAMGAPIRSSMEVVCLSTLPGTKDLPIFMDRYAYEADGVFVINRVKPHTDFHGENESGIAKILSIGLGKHAQALATHERLAAGLREFIPKIAAAVVDTGRILGALGIVEDGYDQTSVIRAVRGEELVRADAELLAMARDRMPSIPFQSLDVLMVDWMGKNISGTGMDPNIIGRPGIRGEPDCPPFSTSLCLFGLTPESHGNALGIGLADVIPKSLYDSVNWEATYENVITSRFVCRGFIPVIRPTDRDVLETSLHTCGYVTAETLRLVRIRDTLHLGEIFVSDALLAEIKDRPSIEVAERGVPIIFDENGRLQKL